MDGPGKKLLSGPGLPTKENGAVSGCHLLDLFKQPQDMRVLADNITKIKAIK